jgi:GTP-binding protein EngB required for normal cell division
MNDIDDLISRLPATLQTSAEGLKSELLSSDALLKVCLVGAFGVGKSSLINMMLGQDLLPRALEESTALPTFIEHGDEFLLQVLNGDGDDEVLDIDSFRRVTIAAPANAACAVLKTPADWLRGLSIIDLPGLGSLSVSNQDYTVSQIQQADAVLYLLEPSGPKAQDIRMLTLVRQYGKRVKVVVAQWDKVEAAAQAGEQRPDLVHWAADIEQQSGVRSRISTASRNGHGRDDILEFLSRAVSERQLIRERRFYAEIKPILQNAIGQISNTLEACAASSDEEIAALHIKLMAQKDELIALKRSMYERQRQESERLATESSVQVTQAQQAFMRAIALSRPVGDINEHSFDAFRTSGTESLRQALTSLATGLSALSTQYGALELPEATVSALNLHFPAPEEVNLGEFLDVARLEQLSGELAEKKQYFESQSQALVALPSVGTDVARHELQQLLGQREQIASANLPRIVREIESGQAGARIGRALGELADIGLIFVNPTTVGAKAASIVGKGAKVANIAVKTTEVAKHVAKGVRLMNAAKTGKRVPAVVEKLGFLEMLSLGYWGERIGSLIDGSPRFEEFTDPDALEEQRAALDAINERIREQLKEKARLEDIQYERELTGQALEQSRAEQAKLTRAVHELQQRADQARTHAEEVARRKHQERVIQYCDRLTGHWTRSYEQQSEAMVDMLRQRAKDYWEEYVAASIASRVDDIDELARRSKDAPQKKEDAMERLHTELVQLQDVLVAIA